MIVLLISGLISNAQTKADSMATEKACRDYVEGWATGDIERVARGVSPELVKAVNTKYGFFEYSQLAKFNGEWRIFNVLWGWIPQKK